MCNISTFNDEKNDDILYTESEKRRDILGYPKNRFLFIQLGINSELIYEILLEG